MKFMLLEVFLETAYQTDTLRAKAAGVLGSSRWLAHQSLNCEVEVTFPQAFYETRS